ncbi:hypothetical protein [Algoriphagus sediminis]|uniref:DKNYY family protein n=1 Tax=Algoriphagus sediminis TaxID=3057113 RepID=A0ABT7YAX0_9BACT|nr:hypothetical protein [Algoriphagus sediminis]MDN3203591.1 hypothetical protein [Algoriphagus sediminis]
MNRLLLISFLAIFLFSCDREIEDPIPLGFEYQPLEVGLFWVYEVNQTIYFGENDFESESFFYRDEVRTFFLNEERESVFVVDRFKSIDQSNWVRESSFTRHIKDFSFLENRQNQISVNLVFPPSQGTSWDANIYTNQAKDDFEYVSSISFEQGERSEADLLRVLQNEDDDEITFRDNRYEIYARDIGLVEKYFEVVTYCSRNDCLGDQLIDSGKISFMKLVDYGRE